MNNACFVGFKEIKYNMLTEGNTEDATNQFDTDETVKDLQEHNATYRAICPN